MNDCGRRTRASFLVRLGTVVAVVIVRGTLLAQSTESAQAAPQPATATEATIRILVSGRLLGYFRMPNEQSDALDNCPGDWNDGDAKSFRETLKAAKAFKDPLTKKDRNTAPTIVVGMGENFSPDFFSRVMSDSKTPNGRSPWFGKDRFTWDWDTKSDSGKGKWLRNWGDVSKPAKDEIESGRGYIPADNVACFLSGAGFDVVVPGKHDLYFGPERLRMIARLLATPELGARNGSTPPARVEMLAANLVIRTSFRDPGEPVPDASKQNLPFVTRSDILQPATFKDGDAILPYVRTFRFTTKQKIPDLRAALRSGNTGHPDKLNPTTVHLVIKQKRDDVSGVFNVTVSLPRDAALVAGSNYGVCLDGTGVTSKGLPYCVRFSTDSPFFQYPNQTWTKANAASGQRYNDPRPFFVKRQEDGKVVTAVFGVVDPKLREHVGELNTMWWNKVDKTYKTEIALVDPVRALKQVLESFDNWYAEEVCGKKTGADYDKCAETTGKYIGVKVLMAQMRSSEVRELSAKMETDFDLFISEAEPERATPNQTIEFAKLDPPRSQGDPPKRRSYLFVPRPAYDPTPGHEHTNIDVRTVDVTPNVDGNARYVISGAPQPTSAELVKLCDRAGFQGIVRQAWDAMAAHVVPPATLPWPPSRAECETGFQDLALSAIRQQANADVALLQRRDFYFYAPKSIAASIPLADTVDRILWKGDFLLKLMVTGSTLKSVLKRGAAFDAQDSELLSLEVEKQRGLVALGVRLDPERKEYLINGASLDESRLYTVATSDYVALGDTGYSELATPVVGHSLLPQDFKTLYLISDVLTSAIKANMDPNAAPEGIPADGYFDFSTEHPPNVTNGLTAGDRLIQWLRLNSNAAAFDKMTVPERLVQNRRVGFVSLQKALVSFSNVHNNVSEQERSSAFAGVALAQVNAKASTAVSVASQARAGLSYRYLDLFATEDLAFSQTSTDRSALPRLQNYLDDRLIGEAGVFWRPNGKAFPHLGPQLSMRVETQVVRPLESFALASSLGATLDLQRDRSTNLLPRLGFRGENRKSSVDIGYEAAFVARIERYDFSGSSGTLPCDVDPKNATSVGTCVKNASMMPSSPINSATDLSIVQTRSFRNAFFADAKFVLPGPDWMVFTSQWSSELFLTRAGDNSTMTHWRYQASAALTLKIFQNLSAQPEVDYFRFQNQVATEQFRQWKTLLGLNYTFDWFSGNPGRALQRGKTPTPASQ